MRLLPISACCLYRDLLVVDDRAVRTASPARNSVDLARDGSNDELEHANLPPLSKATSSDDLASTGKNGVDHDDCVGCVGAGSTENADEIAASTPAGVVEPVLGRTHSFKHYPSWILLSVRDNVRDRAGTAGDAEQEQDARPAASDGITAEVLPVKRRKSLWKRTKRFLTNCFGRCSCTNPPVRCD